MTIGSLVTIVSIGSIASIGLIVFLGLLSPLAAGCRLLELAASGLRKRISIGQFQHWLPTIAAPKGGACVPTRLSAKQKYSRKCSNIFGISLA